MGRLDYRLAPCGSGAARSVFLERGRGVDRVGEGILSEKEVCSGRWVVGRNNGSIGNHRTEDGGLGKTSWGKTKRRGKRVVKLKRGAFKVWQRLM